MGESDEIACEAREPRCSKLGASTGQRSSVGRTLSGREVITAGLVDLSSEIRGNCDIKRDVISRTLKKEH